MLNTQSGLPRRIMSPWIRTSDIPVSSDSTRLKEVCSLDAVSLKYILQKYIINKLDILYKLKLKDSRKK